MNQVLHWLMAVKVGPFAHLALVDDNLMSRGKATSLSAFYLLFDSLDLRLTPASQHCWKS